MGLTKRSFADHKPWNDVIAHVVVKNLFKIIPKLYPTTQEPEGITYWSHRCQANVWASTDRMSHSAKQPWIEGLILLY